MYSVRLYIFWALLVALVPAVAYGLGRRGGRVDSYFSLSCLPIMFLLLTFFPRAALEPQLAVLASLAAVFVVAAAYAAASPPARHAFPRLLGVLAFVNFAALGALKLSAEIGTYAFALVLTATMAVAAWLGVQVVKRVT